VVSRSNDRPNVHITVRKIVHPLHSFEDLAFLIPNNWEPGDELPKFLVFFDNIDESTKAAEFLKSRLPPEYRSKIAWFNSRMTAEFREETLQDFRDGKFFSLCCTDSFGMVCL
ncbi:hypothetical protein OBBRIDRAFT_703370, partial [Obba rivulosa]